MRYLLVTDNGYDGYAIEEYDSLAKLCDYTLERTQYDPVENYKVYEIVSRLNLPVLIEQHAENKEAARQVALAKLTPEECVLPGITKA